jgi:hypothetical protein
MNVPVVSRGKLLHAQGQLQSLRQHLRAALELILDLVDLPFDRVGIVLPRLEGGPRPNDRVAPAPAQVPEQHPFLQDAAEGGPEPQYHHRATGTGQPFMPQKPDVRQVDPGSDDRERGGPDHRLLAPAMDGRLAWGQRSLRERVSAWDAWCLSQN